MSKGKVGFIGLGSMGAPIARRLARCDFDVTGCDISEEMLADFDEPGTARSADPMETARSPHRPPAMRMLAPVT